MSTSFMIAYYICGNQKSFLSGKVSSAGRNINSVPVLGLIKYLHQALNPFQISFQLSSENTKMMKRDAFNQ